MPTWHKPHLLVREQGYWYATPANRAIPANAFLTSRWDNIQVHQLSCQYLRLPIPMSFPFHTSQHNEVRLYVR